MSQNAVRTSMGWRGRAARAAELWGDGFGALATRSVQTLAVLAVVALAVFVVVRLSVVGIPVLLAVIVASAISPGVRWMRRHGVPATAATWVALIAIVLVLGGVIALVVQAVLGQWDDLVDSAGDGMGAVQAFVDGLPFAVSLPDLDQVTQWARDLVASSGFRSGALAGFSATADVLTGFGVFVVVLFFFLKDGRAIWEFLLRPFHGEAYERGVRAGLEAAASFGSYLRGTTIVAAADAIGIGIGLIVLQVPLALPLAVIVFVTAFIPIVGATLAGILAALVALVANGLLPAVIVIVIVIVVNQLEGNLLQPVVMGRTLKLHPLVILIALTVGATLGGVLGAIIAVPLTAAAWSVVLVWDGSGTPARFARPRPDAERERVHARVERARAAAHGDGDADAEAGADAAVDAAGTLAPDDEPEDAGRR